MQELLQLNITDYIIVAVIVISTLISLLRGFLKELISLIIWVLGFCMAIKFHDDFATILIPYIANVTLRIISSFASLFLIVLILGAIFSRLLSFIIIKSGLTGFDRLLGMIFGLIRGVLLIAVILLLISTTSFVQDDWWKKSVLIPHLQIVVDWLHIFLPQKLTALVNVVK